MQKKYIGYLGENYAAHYLHSKGCEILENNFAMYGGEIDLIARKSDTIIFVEVKTRTGNQFGTGGDNINFWKKKHLLTAAMDYLHKNSVERSDFRIDLIEVNLNGNGEVASIEHLEDIMNKYE